ncbi:hypothetical protein RxyAA322_18760 [Rubrobacter xylanophilus]|uniref:Gram-positive cocci surface proteins LPxTG domain-containing protein n=1 Tax=Rubrobacter xylanophilus TaxID=49319 RepID=A0A510HJ41_9ACTN|nr:hypothetical protein [Rubrobacter xylanophilus]BBL80022.1 hypothetical protein RxyAA322_18760 [Rubrobacter xylanophilus]
MLVAAMLAMALVAAAPALAQANAVGGDVQIQDQTCAQVIQVIGGQAQYGDAGAFSGDLGSAAAADIAQQLGISVDAVQNCLQAGEDVSVEQGEEAVVVESWNDNHGDDNGSSHGATASATASAAAATGGVLPETGGASLLALGAGALLVAGGLLARRILR